MKSKILIITIVLSILVSACVLPVSADDGAYYKFRLNFDFDTLNASYIYQRGFIDDNMNRLNNTSFVLYDRVVPVDYDGEWASFEFTPPVTTSEELLYTGLIMPYGISTFSNDGNSTIMSVDDTLSLEAGRFYVGIDTEFDALIKARFTIRPVLQVTATGQSLFGGVLASTDVIDINIDESSRSYFDYPAMNFTFTDVYEEDVETPVFLCVEFVLMSTEYYQLTIMNYESSLARVFYSGIPSPNNPIFGGASGKDEFKDFGNAEQDVLDSQQAGIDAGKGAMSSAGAGLNTLDSQVNLLAGTALISGYLTRITGAVGLWPLVEISIALGLFASLLGLAGSIVTAKDSKSSSGSKPSRNSKSNKKGG